MRLCLSVVLAWLAVSGLPGCGGRAKRMSEYPYFVKTLNRRWGVVLGSFRSDKPNISYVVILLKDLAGAQEAMESSYHESNRATAIAKLDEVVEKFEADLRTKVDMRFGDVRLLPGATVEDVGVIVEAGYKDYLGFKALVELN